MFKQESMSSKFDEDDDFKEIDNELSELMHSDFFDTIQSVETDDNIPFNLNDNCSVASYDNYNTEDSVSPRAKTPESESCDVEMQPNCVSPLSNATDESIEIMTPVSHINKPIIAKIVNCPIRTIIKSTPKKEPKLQSITKGYKPIVLPYGLKGLKIINKNVNNHLNSTKVNTDVRNTIIIKKGIQDIPVLNERTKVILTSEEEQLLTKEGVDLPLYYPLTKKLDSALKSVRRRIRNKLSAQDSRKRKKEYLDKLEEKVKVNSEEKKHLMEHIEKLQKDNRMLRARVNSLQRALYNSMDSTKTKSSTYLLIMLLAVTFVVFPNCSLNLMKKFSKEQVPGGVSRTLLSTQDVTEADLIDLLKKLASEQSNGSDPELLNIVRDIESQNVNFSSDKNYFDDNTYSSLLKSLEKYLDDNPNNVPVEAMEPGVFRNKSGYLEPDIDEAENDALHEVPKRMKVSG